MFEIIELFYFYQVSWHTYTGCPQKCMHVLAADNLIVFSLQIKPIEIDDGSQTKL